MKILILDIETSPNTAHVWGLWQNNVSLNQLLESSYVLCWAAKWHGKPKVYYASIYDNTKEEMLEQVHAMMDEADVIVHYNGKKFDIPTLNREFVLNRMAPPSPSKQVDVLEHVKRRFRFPSNKLDYVSNALGVGNKHKHEGHTLWIKCMNMVPAAWATMKKYNVQDIKILEKVYDIVLPWINSHPNRALFSDHPEHSCPSCGSTEVTKQGFSTTMAGRWQRYQCGSCGAWSKGEKVQGYKKILKSAF